MHFYHVKAKTASGIVESAEQGIRADSAADAERKMERSIFGEWGKANAGSIIAQVIPPYREFEVTAKFINGSGWIVYHRTIGFMCADVGMLPTDKDLVIQYDLRETPIDVCLETYEAILTFALNRDYFA